MKKIINQAPIVRYRASVSEIFFPDSWYGSFSAESQSLQSLLCAIRDISLREKFWGFFP
jgi:hypothetical protein